MLSLCTVSQTQVRGKRKTKRPMTGARFKTRHPHNTLDRPSSFQSPPEASYNFRRCLPDAPLSPLVSLLRHLLSWFMATAASEAVTKERVSSSSAASSACLASSSPSAAARTRRAVARAALSTTKCKVRGKTKGMSGSLPGKYW